MACPLISPTTHAIISGKHRAVKFWKSVNYARDFTKFMKMKCKTKNIKGKKKLNSHFSHRLPLDRHSNLSTFASICSQLHICESFPPEFQLKNKLA